MKSQPTLYDIQKSFAVDNRLQNFRNFKLPKINKLYFGIIAYFVLVSLMGLLVSWLTLSVI